MIEIEFIDTSSTAYLTHPIRKASHVEGVYKKAQQKKYGEDFFALCPGMLDLKNVGYIIPAWTEFKIYADKENTYCYMGSNSSPVKHDMVATGTCPYNRWTPSGGMNEKIVDGIPNEIKNIPLHLNSPWVIKGNTTLLALPAYFHSTMLNDLSIWPGLVDIEDGKFNTFNIIMSAKRPGEFVIKPGEPLVHVIPFTKEDCKATYGPNMDGAPGEHLKAARFSSLRQWYRRHIMRKTKHTLEKNYDKL